LGACALLAGFHPFLFRYLNNDTSMAGFITTVKNSRPSTHWKDFSKSNEVTTLKKAIIDVQKESNRGNSSGLARQLCERMKKRPTLYEMQHLI
jgi:hypothetical protein